MLMTHCNDLFKKNSDCSYKILIIHFHTKVLKRLTCGAARTDNVLNWIYFYVSKCVVTKDIKVKYDCSFGEISRQQNKVLGKAKMHKHCDKLLVLTESLYIQLIKITNGAPRKS